MTALDSRENPAGGQSGAAGAKRGGNGNLPRIPGIPFREWLLRRCEVRDMGHSSPCWVWQLNVVGRGYASGVIPKEFRRPGSREKSRIHRDAYRLLAGEFPDSLQIDHLCRVKNCVNPDHLEPVDNAENMRRSQPFRKRVPRTHCKFGHELTPENIDWTARYRSCRTCRNEYFRNYASARRKRLLTVIEPVGSPAGQSAPPEGAANCRVGAQGVSPSSAAPASIRQPLNTHVHIQPLGAGEAHDHG